MISFYTARDGGVSSLSLKAYGSARRVLYGMLENNKMKEL